MGKLPEATPMGAKSAEAELMRLRARYPAYTDHALLLYALALKYERIVELEDTIDYERGIACDMASRWACAMG